MNRYVCRSCASHIFLEDDTYKSKVASQLKFCPYCASEDVVRIEKFGSKETWEAYAIATNTTPALIKTLYPLWDREKDVSFIFWIAQVQKENAQG